MYSHSESCSRSSECDNWRAQVLERWSLLWPFASHFRRCHRACASRSRWTILAPSDKDSSVVSEEAVHTISCSAAERSLPDHAFAMPIMGRATAATVAVLLVVVSATTAASTSAAATDGAFAAVRTSQSPPPRPHPRRCDASSVATTLRLSSVPAWERQAGWWVGNLSLFNADGAPSVSKSWPYGFGAYAGFIRIRLVGSRLVQRNVFVYPPLSESDCAARSAAGTPTVVGGGTCGVNGNERVFEADQTAVDCAGNMQGNGTFGDVPFTSTTTVLTDDAVLYRVTSGGLLLQNQLTTTFPGGARVRNAQSFLPSPSGDPALMSASFYREARVRRRAWEGALAAARAAAGVRAQDYCAWDAGGAPTNVSCSDFFDV